MAYYVPEYFDVGWWRDHQYITAYELEHDYTTKVIIPWHSVVMYKLERLDG